MTGRREGSGRRGTAAAGPRGRPGRAGVTPGARAQLAPDGSYTTHLHRYPAQTFPNLPTLSKLTLTTNPSFLHFLLPPTEIHFKTGLLRAVDF